MEDAYFSKICQCSEFEYTALNCSDLNIKKNVLARDKVL